MTKGHIISELTPLHKILCFPACGTINIKPALQGEIYSGENSELGRDLCQPGVRYLSSSRRGLRSVLVPSGSPPALPIRQDGFPFSS